MVLIRNRRRGYLALAVSAAGLWLLPATGLSLRRCDPGSNPFPRQWVEATATPLWPRFSISDIPTIQIARTFLWQLPGDWGCRSSIVLFASGKSTGRLSNLPGKLLRGLPTRQTALGWKPVISQTGRP